MRQRNMFSRFKPIASELLDAQMLSDHQHNEKQSDDRPDDTKNPNVDRVVTHAKQVSEPKKDLDAQVEQEVDDCIARANGCVSHLVSALRKRRIIKKATRLQSTTADMKIIGIPSHATE